MIRQFALGLVLVATSCSVALAAWPTSLSWDYRYLYHYWDLETEIKVNGTPEADDDAVGIKWTTSSSLTTPSGGDDCAAEAHHTEGGKSLHADVSTSMYSFTGIDNDNDVEVHTTTTDTYYGEMPDGTGKTLYGYMESGTRNNVTANLEQDDPTSGVMLEGNMILTRNNVKEFNPDSMYEYAEVEIKHTSGGDTITLYLKARCSTSGGFTCSGKTESSKWSAYMRDAPDWATITWTDDKCTVPFYIYWDDKHGTVDIKANVNGTEKESMARVDNPEGLLQSKVINTNCGFKAELKITDVFTYPP
jgi:hypothetical protein